MRSSAVHPSYRPPISTDQIIAGKLWPSVKYVASPVPSDGELKGFILSKRETWPTPEYSAQPHKGFLRTGEFVDPHEYKGSGTHYLSRDGGIYEIKCPTAPHLSFGDPRRYILRRAREKRFVEICGPDKGEDVLPLILDHDWVWFREVKIP